MGRLGWERGCLLITNFVLTIAALKLFGWGDLKERLIYFLTSHGYFENDKVSSVQFACPHRFRFSAPYTAWIWGGLFRRTNWHTALHFVIAVFVEQTALQNIISDFLQKEPLSKLLRRRFQIIKQRGLWDKNFSAFALTRSDVRDFVLKHQLSNGVLR